MNGPTSGSSSSTGGECDNDDMDDIWVEGQSWTEPACGFIPSVLTRLDHLTEAGSEDPELSLRVHLVDLD